jgi:hypothetical protein
MEQTLTSVTAQEPPPSLHAPAPAATVADDAGLLGLVDIIDVCRALIGSAAG